MRTRHPSDFHQGLTEERLSVIAETLLDVRFQTKRLLQSEFDDNYTRETAIFGRTKNRLISMALDSKRDWMTLGQPTMDFTLKIEGVPVRVFAEDDPDAPQKGGFFRRSTTDDLFATDDEVPVMFRFIVERAPTDDAEDRVFFHGYNAQQVKVLEWLYRPATRVLHAVDDVIPQPVDLPPPEVGAHEGEDESKAGKDVQGRF